MRIHVLHSATILLLSICVPAAAQRAPKPATPAPGNVPGQSITLSPSLAPLAPDALDFETMKPALDIQLNDMKLDAMASGLGSDITLLDAPLVASLDRMSGVRNLEITRMPAISYSTAGAPRAPWRASDPADSLYRLARESLNAGEYRRAANLFEQVGKRYPKSEYRSDAAYWRAFALYRIGGIADLHEALQVLDSAAPSGRASFTPAPSIGGSGGGTVTVRASVAPRVEPAWAPAGSNAHAVIVGRAMPLEEGEALTNAAAMKTVFLRDSGMFGMDTALLKMRIRSALAARGDSTAAAQIARTASSAGSSCDEEDAQLRIEALNALVQTDPATAESAITQVLARRDACSVSLRRGAVMLVGRTPSAHSTDLLISAARNDPAIEVRAEAMSWLARSTDDRTPAALVSIATSDTSSVMQRIAVRALAAQKSAAARRALRSLMSRSNLPDDVRVTALHYADTSDLQVSELAKIYDASADRATRQEILRLLTLRPEPEAADKLISIARTSTDPAMRRRAIDALSSRKDPRTTKLLMDIIGK